MPKFYNRRWELSVNNKVFIPATIDGREFKIIFEIVIDYGAFISYADISIYNLSQNTIGKLLKKGSSISLKAGYVNNIDFIFKGSIINAFKGRVGPDTIINIIARSRNQLNTTISETLGVDVKITTILKTLATSLGYPLIINEKDFDNIQPYPRGYVMSGDPRSYLDKLALTHDFSYVIENNTLVITRNTSFRPGTPFEVSQRNGMEGIPEITEIGCDAVVRLSPQLKIGGRIDVKSELSSFNYGNLYFQDIPASSGKGVYRIFKLRHSGDSHGSNWSTEITAKR